MLVVVSLTSLFLQHLQDSELYYFVIGSANFVENSMRHMSSVPADSLKFFFAKPDTGGFSIISFNSTQLSLTFISHHNRELYQHSMSPRKHWVISCFTIYTNIYCSLKQPDDYSSCCFPLHQWALASIAWLRSGGISMHMHKVYSHSHMRLVSVTALIALQWIVRKLVVVVFVWYRTTGCLCVWWAFFILSQEMRPILGIVYSFWYFDLAKRSIPKYSVQKLLYWIALIYRFIKYPM